MAVGGGVGVSVNVGAGAPVDVAVGMGVAVGFVSGPRSHAEDMITRPMDSKVSFIIFTY